MEELGNYDEVKQEIAAQLAALRDTPQRCACVSDPPSSPMLWQTPHQPIRRTRWE